MKYTPVSKSDARKEVISLFILLLAIFLLIATKGVSIILTTFIALFTFNKLPNYFKYQRFQSLPRQTTEARIIDRRVKRHDDGKGTFYIHYVTYRFYTLEDEKVFDFEEKVSEELYNSLNIGTVLTVEYAITEPWLARSSLPLVKKVASGMEKPMMPLLGTPYEETPVYPDAPEA